MSLPLPIVVRVTRLAIEDLLEHLAHARPHEGVLLGLGVVISTADPRQLAGIELRFAFVIRRIEDVIGVVVHGGIVARGTGSVNGCFGALEKGATR